MSHVTPNNAISLTSRFCLFRKKKCLVVVQSLSESNGFRETLLVYFSILWITRLVRIHLIRYNCAQHRSLILICASTQLFMLSNESESLQASHSTANCSWMHLAVKQALRMFTVTELALFQLVRWEWVKKHV